MALTKGGGVDSDREAEVMAQLLVFAEQTPDFVGVSDPWGRVIFLNSAACKRLGVAGPGDLTTADIFPVDEFTLYHEVVRPQLLRTGAWSGEVRVNIAGGVAVPMYVSVSTRVGPGGETLGTVMYAHDLAADGRGAAERGFPMDEITGLLPRPAFDERVRLALAGATRAGVSCAFVLATVVNMDDTIERFDVPGGTAVMRALAGRMTRLARTIDIVGHVDDHRLGILLLGVHTRGDVLRIARMVSESLVDVPIPTPSGDIAAFVGCGIAVCEPDDDLAALIARVSATTPREQVPHVDADRLRVGPDRPDGPPTKAEFRVGMTQGEVRAYAQPMVDLGSGLVVGYRGLARWQHRRLGLLEAADFVGMIAETALATQVDLYVARETAAVLALTTRSTPLCLYAPVSRRLIEDVRTEQYLGEIAEAFSLTTNQIHVQVARPLLDDRSPALHDALHSLRDTDVRLVLSGVARPADAQDLDEYGFGELHLSNALTSAAAHAADARRTVSEIVSIAHERGLLVAACGVNDEGHRDVLVESGCDLASGDLYGRPEPADTID